MTEYVENVQALYKNTENFAKQDDFERNILHQELKLLASYQLKSVPDNMPELLQVQKIMLAKKREADAQLRNNSISKQEHVAQLKNVLSEYSRSCQKILGEELYQKIFRDKL